MKKHLKHIFIVLFVTVFVGCSTEKDKRLNKFYHNTTAYYNGYFNAREIIKVSHKQYVKGIPEDFTQIIPVNRYPNEEESKAFFPEMNRAIDKTSTVIGKHAMPNEKKGRDAKVEYGNWIDENWMVMGISYFYKREYEAANEKFEYIVKMYPKDESKYYAKLWLAKSHIENGEYTKAFGYIKEIEVEKEAQKKKEVRKEKTKKRRKNYSKRKKKQTNRRSKIKRTKKREEVKEDRSFLVEFPENMTADYFATQADYFLRKEEYVQAVELLDSAIKYEKTKKTRVRYHFIQAQLHQELGNLPFASEKYSYVIKKSSSYTMVFYSKINRALSASNKDRAKLKKELLDLAKDEKYIEFRDQLYYALADIELQEYNTTQGITYLEKSASYPPSNKKQKAKTFNRLADVHFEEKNYVSAQKYYDSTLGVLEPENPLRAPISERNKSLTRLVYYLNTIAMADSMLAIGNLSEKQRRDRVEEIIYTKKSKELEAERLRSQAEANQSGIPTLPQAGGGEKGSFWIYNEKNKANGIKFFTGIWGNIPLEDNWRRSSKNQASSAPETQGSNSLAISDNEIDEFLKEVPVTEEDKAETRNSILNANYLAGLIYSNILGDNTEAIAVFKDNKKRFHPDSKITPSLYQLYVLYQSINQSGDEVAVKNFILENYPNSKEAKIILDPDFVTKSKSEKNASQKAYEEVYLLVNNEQYANANTKIKQLLNENENHPLLCELLYLQATSYSGLGNKELLDSALQKLVDKCPGTQLGDRAEVTLGKLRNERIAKEESADVAYKKGEGEHYFCVLVPVNEDLNNVKIALSNFNSSSFDEKGLKVSSLGLNSEFQTIVVKEFPTKAEAASYMIGYKVNPAMKDFVLKYTYFTITPANYSLLYSSKQIKQYQSFFNRNYF